jgi:NADPH:quinone reductase-like Zn-dependent oxidoreductase
MPPLAATPGKRSFNGGIRMKAIVVEHRGEAGSLKDVPMPKPSESEILVRVTVAGVNPIDWKRRDRADEKLPFVLGQDFAGVVSETGKRATKYRQGERVFGITHHGSYAQYTLVPQDDPEQPIAKIPDAIGDADAAALPTAGLTALASIEALHVSNGMSLLIVGATGGVGSLATQMGHDRGARVIGVARSSNESLARSLGVDEFVPYDLENVAQSVKHAHPEGVDAVLDLVDDADALEGMAEVVRAGGNVVSTIRSADVEWFAQHKITAQNIAVFTTPQYSHTGLRTLLELIEQGRLRVTIAGERPLADALAALEDSQRGSVNGKILITVD